MAFATIHNMNTKVEVTNLFQLVHDKGIKYSSCNVTISRTVYSCFSGQSLQTSLQFVNNGTLHRLCGGGPGAPIVHQLPGIPG
jgi:hypothetical protein